jgi:hypothetical protein
MIHSMSSEFTHAAAGTFHTIHTPSSASHDRGAHTHAMISSGARTFSGFAEPAIGALWDADLLDRLTVPLTRYHE